MGQNGTYYSECQPSAIFRSFFQTLTSALLETAVTEMLYVRILRDPIIALVRKDIQGMEETAQVK